MCVPVTIEANKEKETPLFRYWLTEQNRFMSEEFMVLADGTPMMLTAISRRVVPMPRGYLSMFTGAYDLNGNPIYGGDLVYYQGNRLSPTIVKYDAEIRGWDMTCYISITDQEAGVDTEKEIEVFSHIWESDL